MLAWSCAKLYGRSHNSGGKGKGKKHWKGEMSGMPACVNGLLQSLAHEASQRMMEFMPQGVSNIAWSFGTLGLLGPQYSSTRRFLEDAMRFAGAQLDRYSPQAVANLLWAAVRVPPLQQGAGDEEDAATAAKFAFAAAAAREATCRMIEFSWRDLAGMCVAFSHGQVKIHETVNFATVVVSHAALHCRQLTTQMMLNIAQSALRLGVGREAMMPFVNAIHGAVQVRGLQFNEVDQRQWDEVLHRVYTPADGSDWTWGASSQYTNGYSAQSEYHQPYGNYFDSTGTSWR